MRPRVPDTRDRDERYGHPPGGFHWQIERLDVGHPTVSRLARNICRDRHIWPEQLLGRSHAGVVVYRSTAPLSTGPADEPMRGARFAFGRHLLWRASYELTELAVETIAELTGFAPGTVAAWARDTEWRRFQAREGEVWWWYHGPSIIDSVGCEIPEYLDRRQEAPRDTADPAR